MKSKESWFRYDLVWEKTNAVGFLLANKMPMRSHENIYVFAKKGARYYRKDIEGDFPPSHYSNHVRSQTSNVVPRVKDLESEVRVPVREGIRCVRSVVKTSTKKGKGNHPTQKPAELYTWLLERYSKEGDTILDPTSGSFTSVFTASSMNRKAIGIEKEEAFYNKAVSNLSKT
jgi:site-specific DNA-methyltransferase (adenine-specific)